MPLLAAALGASSLALAAVSDAEDKQPELVPYYIAGDLGLPEATETLEEALEAEEEGLFLSFPFSGRAMLPPGLELRDDQGIKPLFEAVWAAVPDAIQIVNGKRDRVQTEWLRHYERRAPESSRWYRRIEIVNYRIVEGGVPLYRDSHGVESQWSPRMRWDHGAPLEEPAFSRLDLASAVLGNLPYHFFLFFDGTLSLQTVTARSYTEAASKLTDTAYPSSSGPKPWGYIFGTTPILVIRGGRVIAG